MLLKGRPAASRIERFGVSLGGTIDGANQVFTTPDVFDPLTLRVFYNGVRMTEGASNDYEITGSAEITMTFAPLAAPGMVDRLEADYVVD